MPTNYQLLQTLTPGKVVSQASEDSLGNNLNSILKELDAFKPNPSPTTGRSDIPPTTPLPGQDLLTTASLGGLKAHPELLPTINAISAVESSGNYNSVSIPSKNGDKAYGRYQIMGKNIPSWSTEALGYPVTKEQFLKDPKIQDKVALFHINKSLEQGYSPQDTASIWFSGRPMKQAGNSKDAYGTTVPQYIKRFNQNYLGFKVAVNNQVPSGPGMGDSPNPLYNSNPYGEPVNPHERFGEKNWKIPDSNMPYGTPGEGGSQMPSPYDFPDRPEYQEQKSFSTYAKNKNGRYLG